MSLHDKQALVDAIATCKSHGYAALLKGDLQTIVDLHSTYMEEMQYGSEDKAKAALDELTGILGALYG